MDKARYIYEKLGFKIIKELSRDRVKNIGFTK
jgi:hypothetical protein